MRIYRASALLLVAAAALTLGACSTQQAQPARNDAAPAREQAAIDRLNLKQSYKDVVMSTEIQNTTLVLYVDENNLQSMDEDAESAMLDRVLLIWKSAWLSQHHGRHAVLHLRLSNYYGQEVLSRSVRV